MNIYLISQYENVGADTYKSAVVIAIDSDAARNTDPRTGLRMGEFDWLAPYPQWASHPERVVVQHIGVALPEMPPGLILSHVRGH